MTWRFGWWFQMSFIFSPTWKRFPFWLIFFRWGWNHQPEISKHISLPRCPTIIGLFVPVRCSLRVLMQANIHEGCQREVHILHGNPRHDFSPPRDQRSKQRSGKWRCVLWSYFNEALKDVERLIWPKMGASSKWIKQTADLFVKCYRFLNQSNNSII